MSKKIRVFCGCKITKKNGFFRGKQTYLQLTERLFKQYVGYETNALYLAGIAEISRRNIVIQAIVCDGRQGLSSLFGNIPIQICQSPGSDYVALSDPKLKDTGSH
jgi:hypothetical protein